MRVLLDECVPPEFKNSLVGGRQSPRTQLNTPHSIPPLPAPPVLVIIIPLWPVCATGHFCPVGTTAHMRFLASIFVPTGNRRLNELIGFVLCVSALSRF